MQMEVAAIFQSPSLVTAVDVTGQQGDDDERDPAEEEGCDEPAYEAAILEARDHDCGDDEENVSADKNVHFFSPSFFLHC
jgi:hypothetical protein